MPRDQVESEAELRVLALRPENASSGSVDFELKGGRYDQPFKITMPYHGVRGYDQAVQHAAAELIEFAKVIFQKAKLLAE
jgi:hypothetical protein